MPRLTKLIRHKLGIESRKKRVHRSLESHIAEVLRYCRIDTAIDVGANSGQFGALLRRIGFRGHIYSVEPVRAAFETLSERSVADGRWTAHNLALGQECGKAFINVSHDTKFSSLLAANEFGGNRWAAIATARQEEVELITLDRFTERYLNHDSERIFLKLDTQGYDLMVFRGGPSTVSRVYALLSELSLAPIYAGMPNYLDALSTFNALGFQASGFYPVSRNGNLSLIEVDCMLVRTTC